MYFRGNCKSVLFMCMYVYIDRSMYTCTSAAIASLFCLCVCMCILIGVCIHVLPRQAQACFVYVPSLMAIIVKLYKVPWQLTLEFRV